MAPLKLPDAPSSRLPPCALIPRPWREGIANVSPRPPWPPKSMAPLSISTAKFPDGEHTFSVLTDKDREGPRRVRHSSPHMARAVLRLSLGVQLASGPTIENVSIDMEFADSHRSRKIPTDRGGIKRSSMHRSPSTVRRRPHGRGPRS